MTSTKYWEHVKAPHSAALNNLRTMANYLIEQGAIQPSRTESAYNISAQTNISYNQVLNLIKKPGFVRVFGPNGAPVGYFYAVAELGSPYPDKFAPGLKIPREFSFVEPMISNPEVAAEVERAANHNSNAQPQMDFSTASVPAGQLKKSQLANAWNTVFEQGILNKTRTPAQIAGFAYKLAEAIHNGTITLED